MNRFNLPNDPAAIIPIMIGILVVGGIFWLVDHGKGIIMTTTEKGISPDDFQGIIMWWIVFGLGTGCLWGIINGFLIQFEVFHRTITSEMPMAGFIFGEWVCYCICGIVSGFAISLINGAAVDARFSPKNCFLAISSWWSGEINYQELHKALELLDTASTQKDDKDIMVCIGRAKECVLRALGE